MRWGVSGVSALIAHALAWAAVLFVVVVPAYEGEMVEATLPGEPPAEVVQTTMTFLEVNGLYGLGVALAPVLITALVLLGLSRFRRRHLLRMATLWMATMVVVAFCLGAIFSVGLFYFPAALALFVAALTDLAQRPGEA